MQRQLVAQRVKCCLKKREPTDLNNIEPFELLFADLRNVNVSFGRLLLLAFRLHADTSSSQQPCQTDLRNK